ERSFAEHRRRCLLSLPMNTAIDSRANLRAAVERVAHHISVRRVPKRDAVEKALRVGVSELECPMPARIAGLIDARFLARTDAHHPGRALVDRADTAEIERFR